MKKIIQVSIERQYTRTYTANIEVLKELRGIELNNWIKQNTKLLNKLNIEIHNTKLEQIESKLYVKDETNKTGGYITEL